MSTVRTHFLACIQGKKDTLCNGAKKPPDHAFKLPSPKPVLLSQGSSVMDRTCSLLFPTWASLTLRPFPLPSWPPSAYSISR